MKRVASSTRSLRMCVAQRGSLWLSRYGGGQSCPFPVWQNRPPTSPKALHSRQHNYTLPSNHASIRCFLNYILRCAHGTSCGMWLLGAISELQLYCAAPYTHPQCWQAAPILAHPTHAHISLEPPWIATQMGTIDMYVFQEFQNCLCYGQNRWH